MNDHNLDDLIIGDPKSQSSNSKSLLSIIALVIIILLMGVFLAQLIMSSPKDDITLSDDSNAELISPELIPIDTKVNRKSTAKNDSFTPIKRVKPPEKTAVKKPQNTDRIVALEKPTVKKSIQKKQDSKKQTVKKPQTKKSVKKPSTLFKKSQGEKSQKGYYVQLGAFKNRPSQKYFAKIKKAGFRVVVHKRDQLNIVKIGSYSSREKATTAKQKIDSSLNIKGYVVKGGQ